MLVTLNDILPQANENGYAIPCFNCFGYEDSVAIVDAAESLGKPVILAVNKDMVDYMLMASIFGFMRPLAERSSTPVVLHLDHSYDLDTVYQAVDLGATSVMYDGSQTPLADNIKDTAKAVAYAHKSGVSVEGEIGSVPYTTGRDYIKHILTDENDAKIFADETNVDALAISVGNVHKLTSVAPGTIDYALLDKIENNVSVPLVIHGASGISNDDLKKLSQRKIAKFNIGTRLRQVFGHTLRDTMNNHPDEFDRLFFMQQTITPLRDEVIRTFETIT